MDLLDAQATEIRSFLGPDPPATSVPATDTAFSPAHSGPLRQSSTSRSAPGDNSAQSPHQIASSPLTINGAVSSTTAKRRATDEDAEGSSKQQRSKRNRVREAPVFPAEIAPRLLACANLHD